MIFPFKGSTRRGKGWRRKYEVLFYIFTFFLLQNKPMNHVNFKKKYVTK